MLTTRMSVRSDGQWSAGAICLATESAPSCCSPISHRTKPPYILRHALPEPCLNTGKQRFAHLFDAGAVTQTSTSFDHHRKTNTVVLNPDLGNGDLSTPFLDLEKTEVSFSCPADIKTKNKLFACYSPMWQKGPQQLQLKSCGKICLC